MTKRGYCVLANYSLGPVLSGRSIPRWRPLSRSAVENLPVLYDKTSKEFKDKNKKKRMHGNKLYSSWVWSQVNDIKVAEISRAIQCFLPV